MSKNKRSSYSGIVAGIVFMAIICLVIFFLFSEKNRALFVVNHTPKTMTIKLASGATQVLDPNTWFEVEIAIEAQSISLYQGSDSVGFVEFDPTSFTQKDDGVLVYNIASAGIVVWEEIVYSEDPEILESTEGDWNISVGEEIIFFSDADYLFEESPEEIYLTALEAFELKSQVTFLDWEPMEVSDWLAIALEEDPVGATLSYMETQIALGHDDIFFIDNYFDYAESNDETERAKASMSNLGWSKSEWINISRLDNPVSWGVLVGGDEESLVPIANLDSVMVDQRNAKLVLAYPLDTTFCFDIHALDNAFSLQDLIEKTRAIYTQVYDEEKSSSTIKTLYIEDEETGYKRNKTNGIYEIWGFHLEDLWLSGFSQITHGETLYIIPWVYEKH